MILTSESLSSVSLVTDWLHSLHTVLLQSSIAKHGAMELPTLVLDKIFSYLSDQDLRAVHQVSKQWRDTLESQERQGDNFRRMALVERIRQTKENIRDRAKGLEYKARRISRERPVSSRDFKNDFSVVNILNNCTNFSTSTPDNSKDVQLTPTSTLPFQAFAEAEKSLTRGQVLFQCRRCRGPVPSPVPSEISPIAHYSKIESTRCRLTTRMDGSPSISRSLVPERKKSKQLPAIDTPTTIALSEIMSQSLVISGAGSKSVNLQPRTNKSAELSSKALFSPAAIDLSLNRTHDGSIDYRMDFEFADLNGDSSFGVLKLTSNLASPYSSTSFDCPDLCFNVTSELTPSDSLLCDSGISPFSNLILSPSLDSHFVNSAPRQIKTTLVLHPEDFKKPNTLTNSSRILQFSPHSGKDHDQSGDIDSFATNKITLSDATRNARNTSLSNSKLNTSLILSGDKERRLLGTNNVADAYQSPISQLPSFAEAGNDEKLATNSNLSVNTSDYYSHGSMLRLDFVDSQSFIPETYSRRVDQTACNEVEFSTSEFKLRSRSLGNMVDTMEDKFSSFESFSSCPNLSSSFILECPNQSCCFRFCSSCLDSEHPGRPCHVIGSDSIEEIHQTSNFSSKSFSFSSTDANKGKGKSKPAVKANKGKDKLRRLARL